jgi:hypothetical protein
MDALEIKRLANLLEFADESIDAPQSCVGLPVGSARAQLIVEDDRSIF